MSPNSRTIMWTLETILLSLEKCLDSSLPSDEPKGREEAAIARREIHSAPAGGRTDNSMVLDDPSSSIVSYELDYIEAGQAHIMSRMMKTLLRSPVTSRISREHALPNYEALTYSACEWDEYDDNGEYRTEPFRELFGRTYTEADEDDHDLSRRIWAREVLSAGVGKGKLLLHKGQPQANSMKENGQRLLTAAQGINVYETERILFARPGGMTPSSHLVSHKSSLKHSRHDDKRAPSSSRLHTKVSSSTEENKRPGVSFSPNVVTEGTTRNIADATPSSSHHPITHKHLPTSKNTPEPLGTPLPLEEQEEFLIYHKKIEPLLPSQRKVGISPRKPHTPLQTKTTLKEHVAALLEPSNDVAVTSEPSVIPGQVPEMRLKMPGLINDEDSMIDTSPPGHAMVSSDEVRAPGGVWHVDLESERGSTIEDS